MSIQNWSENAILVDLPQEPEIGDELELVVQIVRDRGGCDVVIDFSSVDVVSSSSLSRLLKLRELLADSGSRLILCGIAAVTRGVFKVTGLDKVFEVADDKFIALATLEMTGG